MRQCDELPKKIESQGIRLGDVIVTLEDFFLNNSHRGSIGCNLGADQREISDFYRTLLDIRSKPQVQDVLVRIVDTDTGNWPFSDTVYIITSSSAEEVSRWVVPLKPDEIYAEWMYGAPPRAPMMGKGITPFSIWWD